MTTLKTSKPGAASPLVLANPGQGITLIPTDTPLTRLNYFDGKFLRAEDLQNEQQYLRQLVALSNQAGGAGIVNGLDIALTSGDRLALSPGLAIDPQGRVLLLPAGQALSIADLLARSRAAVGAAAAPATVSGAGQFAACEVAVADQPQPLPGRNWYLVLLAHAEALCGEEDVVGMLCADACAGSSNRPFRLEGVRLRLQPLALSSALASSSAVALSARHLRSQIASAYFADEAAAVGSLISGAGLRSDIWCHGATAFNGSEVALGVLVREGSSTRFVDGWTARRERVAMPPQRYWQQRMAMRPMDVYLAQVLQFQCQLRDVLAGLADDGNDGDDNPCGVAKKLVGEAAAQVQLITSFYRDTATQLATFSRSVREKAFAAEPEFQKNLAQLTRFGERLKSAQAGFTALPRERLLIEGGIVELPAAGWLPVLPGDSPSVNEQVRRLLGDGVDLRFCTVTADYVQHAWESAQHMQRISLLDGLDRADRKPRVDVLVPDGRVAPARNATGRAYEMRMTVGLDNLDNLADAVGQANKRRRAATGKPAAQAGARADAKADAQAGAKADAPKPMLRAAASRATAAGDPQEIELHGAARADAPPGRGLAFHFAGLTDNFAPLASGKLVLRRDDLAGTAVAAAAATAAATAPPPSASQQRNPRPPRVALWVSLSIDDDPTTLARGAQTRTSAEAYMLLLKDAQPQADGSQAATRSLLLRASFSGTLRIDDTEQRQGAQGSVLVDAELSGELMASATDGSEQLPYLLHLSEAVQILRTDGPAGPAYRLSARAPALAAPFVDELSVERAWKTPTEAECTGRVRFAARAASGLDGSAATKALLRQLFHASQTVNAAVAEPAHPAHEHAIRALRAIGTALDGGRFADVKAGLLFPPPAPRSSTQVLLATRDWVLFHRRREKHCEQPAAAQAPATRGYALHQVAVADERALAQLQKAFAGNDTAALAKFQFDFLQVVDYAAGVQSVLSPPAQVRASWRQDVGAAAGSIVGGCMASRGAALAEGKAVAAERAAALIDLLDVEFDVAAQPDMRVAERVPDSFAAGQDDGVIVLATLKQAVVQRCQEVYAVASGQLRKQVLDALSNGRFEVLKDQQLVTALGHVDFSGDVADAADLTAVAAAWPVQFGAPWSNVDVIFRQGDVAQADYGKQTAVIAGALKVPGATVKPTSAPAAPPGCPAISLFTGTEQVQQATLRQALLIFVNAQLPNHFVREDTVQRDATFSDNVPQGSALLDFVRALTPRRLVAGVTVATIKQPDADAPDRLKAVEKALSDAGQTSPAGFARHIEALNAQDRKELQAHAVNPDAFDEVIFFEARG